MEFDRKRSVLMTRVAVGIAMFCAVLVIVAGPGCSSRDRTVSPQGVEESSITGMLVAVKDDRPVDGGIDLTMDVHTGVSELWRVPSSFTPEPTRALQLQAVVGRADIGDHLRATGTRDATGALLVETLEIVNAR